MVSQSRAQSESSVLSISAMASRLSVSTKDVLAHGRLIFRDHGKQAPGTLNDPNPPVPMIDGTVAS